MTSFKTRGMFSRRDRPWPQRSKHHLTVMTKGCSSLPPALASYYSMATDRLADLTTALPFNCFRSHLIESLNGSHFGARPSLSRWCYAAWCIPEKTRGRNFDVRAFRVRATFCAGRRAHCVMALWRLEAVICFFYWFF